MLTFDLDDYVYTALRARTSGFLLKDTPRRELLHAIEVASSLSAPHDATHSRRSQRSPSSPDRERDILLLVARGLDNNEIAGRIVIIPLPPRATSATSCANSTVTTAQDWSPSPTKPD